MAELPPIDSDLVRELEAMTETLAARPDHADLSARLEWLIDTLVLRGQLPPRFKHLAGKVRGEKSTVRLSLFRDKYAIPSSDVDCAERFPICRARCCKFDVTLSAQDVDEGKLQFEIDQPYVLRKHPTTGKCLHAGDNGECGAYAIRPGQCRSYDCRRDSRIWIDFEARIAQPMDP